jgi:hypothetical protein
VDEEQGIYRDEVFTIMGALADVTVDVRKILRYIEGRRWRGRGRRSSP